MVGESRVALDSCLVPKQNRRIIESSPVHKNRLCAFLLLHQITSEGVFCNIIPRTGSRYFAACSFCVWSWCIYCNCITSVRKVRKDVGRRMSKQFFL